MSNQSSLSNVSVAPRRTIQELIQSPKVKEQLALALPKFLTADRLTRIALTAVNRNPKLLQCSPESLLSSIMKAAQMGIEPDGRNGHLIPRYSKAIGGMECTFQDDYKGLVGLVRRDPDVEDVYADLVCENDVCEVTKGLSRNLIHKIDIRAARGAILGAYAVIKFKNGYSAFEWMGTEEIHAVRARSESWKAHVDKGWDTPWLTDEGEMFKKTVIRRLCKLANLSADTAERVTLDVETHVESGPAIERPQIGRQEVPALADVSEAGESGEPEAQAEAAAPEVVAPPKEEKPKLTRTRRAQAAPVEQPAGETPTVLNEVVAKLAGVNMSPEEFLEIVKRQNWCTPDTETLAALGDAKLTMVRDDWESVTEAITEYRAEKGGQA